MEVKVINDIMDDLVSPKERCSESFVLHSLLEGCQEWGVFHWGTWRIFSVSDGKLGLQGYPWVMNDLVLPHGRLTASFMLISLL